MTGTGRQAERTLLQQAVMRALRDGVSIEEGRRRNAQERWSEAEAALAQARCGTRAPIQHDRAERPEQWWQRD